MGKIATKAECNNVVPGAFSGTSTQLRKCPTKYEIYITHLFDSDMLSAYQENQLVQLSDVIAAPSQGLKIINDSSYSVSVDTDVNQYHIPPGEIIYALYDDDESDAEFYGNNRVFIDWGSSHEWLNPGETVYVRISSVVSEVLISDMW